MDILIKFYESWGVVWGAFPLFTLFAIYAFFRVLYLLQNSKRGEIKGGKLLKSHRAHKKI